MQRDSVEGDDPKPSSLPAHPASTTTGGRQAGARVRILIAQTYATVRLIKGQVALFLFNFGVAKAAAFAGPLLLAGLLGSERYGQIELAWSIALVAAAMLGVGVPLSIPLLTMVRRPRPTEDLVAGSVALPGSAMLIGGAVAAWAGHPPAALAFFCTTIALAQASLSSYWRVFSYRNSVSWGDGLATHSIVLIVLILVAAGHATISSIAALAGVTAAIVVTSAGIIMVRWRQSNVAERLRLAITAGVPLLIYAMCSMWAVVSPRILLGAALSVRDVGLYAVCFRIAAGILLIHTAFTIGLFAKLYRMHTREYDIYFTAYVGVLTVISVGLIIMFPFLVQDLGLGKIEPELRPQVIALFPLVMLQIFGCSAWGWSESRLNRARRSRHAAGPTLLLFAAFALLIGTLAWNGAVTLRSLVWLCTAQVFCGIVIQIYVLWRRGMKMPRTIVALSTASATILATGWIFTGFA